MSKLTLFSELCDTPVESRWFKVYCVLPGVTAIYEPYHFQEVISYLIDGAESAVLFDSGMGLGNIKALAESLTDKPITLVNSHSHFDHVGGAWQFGTTHLMNVPSCISKLKQGYSLPADDENRDESALHLAGEPWFDLHTSCVRPCKVIPMEDGDIFSLGDRTLRVLATPGHSADGAMLADDTNRVLFTGDTVYPGPLYAFLDGPDSVMTYADTIHSLAKQYSAYTLCCSHNNPVWEGTALNEIDEGFQKVLHGALRGEPYMKHTIYRFDGFSIVI